MAENKKLFLIDSYALIFRSYYAFISNPMRNAKGMNTSTVFGFTLALDEIIRKENPSHIIAAFDASGPTFRHEMFPEYKANRDATPEDIKVAVPWVKKLLDAYGIPVVEKLGFEADDVIGTLAKSAEKQGFEVYMVTPDKDFAQLVSDNIFMFKPGKGGGSPEILGIPEVKEKFGIEDVSQVIDTLALMGDSSDNIPGAAGIGPKTAQKLIEAYGNVDRIYEHIHELKGKQQENMISSRDNVYLSRILATIVTDAPVTFDPDQAKQEPIDRVRLESIFDELNFKNLKTRILGETKSTKPLPSNSQATLFDAQVEAVATTGPLMKTIENVEHTYRLVNELDALDQLEKELKNQHEICFDTETTGLDIIDSKIVGASFSWKEKSGYYLDLSSKSHIKDAGIAFLKRLFKRSDFLLVGQNLKYDLHILKNYDIVFSGSLFDTMVAHYLVYPDRKHGIDDISEDLLGYRKIKTEDLIGQKGRAQKNFDDLDPEIVKEYACEDADITWQVYLILKDEINKSNIEKLSAEIEMPLVKILMEMEHAGVSLDDKALSEFAEELRTSLIGIESKIFELAGQEFNISSPRQLGEILFDKLKIVSNAKKTKTKQYSTGEDVLVTLLDKHEIVGEVLEFRSLKKLLSTYVEALPQMIHPTSGKIHTSFNQTLVTTGRLSSNNPNLQNIPIREERGREIRKAFTPSPGNRFLSADYSQIELRLMAHLSQDENMITAFSNNEDIHTATAAKVYNISMEEVTREMRSKAKTANFGIIYGISVFGLSQRMRIPTTEAKELIDGYFATYPAVRKYMDECIRIARENGWVETMFGRKRYLPDILSRNSTIRGIAERNAINTPIQGTAADIIKIAMVRIGNELIGRELKTKMIIQVHDELDFDVHPSELEQVKEIVRTSMEQAVNLSVPLLVDMNEGRNWLEAH